MTCFAPISAAVEEVARECIDCAMHVHRNLGPGFRELIYQRAFCLELDSRGVKFECEKRIVVPYKEWMIPGQKVDLIVENVVLVELKAVPKLRKIHQHQVISYLKAMKLRLGLLMNFNTRLLRDGLKRVVL